MHWASSHTQMILGFRLAVGCKELFLKTFPSSASFKRKGNFRCVSSLRRVMLETTGLHFYYFFKRKESGFG